MNGRFQMQGGKNWFLPKEMNANRFFWDSHWLEIWSNHFYPSMGPNGGSVAMDSGKQRGKLGLVWINRKKISQIINDYLYLPFFGPSIADWLEHRPLFCFLNFKGTSYGSDEHIGPGFHENKPKTLVFT
jgi:hypothetical protein